jgi:hypothetical protein
MITQRVPDIPRLLIEVEIELPKLYQGKEIDSGPVRELRDEIVSQWQPALESKSDDRYIRIHGARREPLVWVVTGNRGRDLLTVTREAIERLLLVLNNVLDGGHWSQSEINDVCFLCERMRTRLMAREYAQDLRRRRRERRRTIRVFLTSA